METLKTIRMQLSSLEEAHGARRLSDVVQILETLGDLVEILRSAFFEEEIKAITTQLNRLADLGMVVEDLEDKLTLAQVETDLYQQAWRLEKLWKQVITRVEAEGRLLLRTNIFKRGKKLFVEFEEGDTLEDLAGDLRLQFLAAMRRHLSGRLGRVVDPSEVELAFYGGDVWQNGEAARLDMSIPIVDLLSRGEGIFWFPTVSGLTVSYQPEGEDDDEALMDMLENFTIESNLSALEEQLSQIADQLAPQQQGSLWRARAALVRQDPRSLEEERIPLFGTSVIIGRSSENDIQIMGDPKVSRRHCQLTRENDVWSIADMGSSNGTRVDGIPLKGPYKLSGGEVLGIGNHEFSFQFDVE